MPQVTDSMFKTVISGVIFITLWAGFNMLFIGSVMGDTTNLSIEQVLGQSWAIFTQPELIIINAVFGAVGIIVALFVARELLPV